jgi:voltage-gated potassium channel
MPVHPSTPGDHRGAVIDRSELDPPLNRVRRAALERPDDRELQVNALAARLDLPMTALGAVFLLIVVGQELSRSEVLQRVLETLGWVLWVVFVAEFLLRLAIAPSRAAFLRRNWWQVVFLALPVLRFLRLLSVLRVARAGRVVSSAVRSGRSARRVLSNRLGWLTAVTAIVVLAASQLLQAFTPYPDYADALHATALTTITGEPLGRPDGFSRLVEVLLAGYSVVVFAGLAGALGAFFLQPHLRGRDTPATAGEPARPHGVADGSPPDVPASPGPLRDG